MPEQKTTKVKGSKAKGRRQVKLRTYYKVQFGRTASNKLRRLRKHCRLYQGDNQARKVLGALAKIV